MQPNFTLKNLGSLCSKVAALSLAFVLMTQVSMAQKPSRFAPGPNGAISDAQVAAAARAGVVLQQPAPTPVEVSASAITARGNRVSTGARVQASTTISTAGQPTLPNNNGFGLITFNVRNNNSYSIKLTDVSSIADLAGATNITGYFKTSAVNGAPGAITAGNGWNVWGTQVITASGIGFGTSNTTIEPFLTNKALIIPAGATYGIAIQADQGGVGNLVYSTPAGVPPTFSGGGVDLIVGTSTAGFAGNVAPNAPTNSPRGFIGSITFEECVPTAAGAPTISALPASTCAGQPITMSVISGSLNGAAEWRWYTGSCGGTLVGTGNSITVSPGTTTQYFVRGEGGCAPAPGACGTRTVTVTPCTCVSPDVASICTGQIQPLRVTQPAVPVTSTFNGGAITINSVGTATPYPSNIAVSGLPANGAGVYVQSVTINGFTHTFPDDVDIVLQSPGGKNVILMSDNGEAASASNLNLTFRDDAASGLGSTLTSGTFRPSNRTDALLGVEPDNWPSPGPGSLSQANPTLQTFYGTDNPNGNWKLFVVDDFTGDAGSITSWSITFRIANTATWTGPAGTIFTNPNGTGAYVAGTSTDVVYVAPTAVGANVYTATIAAGPCAGANNVTVTVLQRPTIAVSPTSGCGPRTLTATGGSVYSWSPGNGLNTTVGNTVTATPTANTVYTVTGYDVNGCSNTATATVNGISTASTIVAPPSTLTLLTEGFEGTTLPSGWAQQNNSTPIGTVPTWIFGSALLAPAQNGTANSYALGNFNNVAGNNTISNWLITPYIPNLQNGDVLTFWTRTVAAPQFADRLEVRMNPNNTTNVGASNTSVGDFTTLLTTINSGLSPTGYPSSWTQITVTVSGLSGPGGRFAFRYFVTSGGPSGANSDNVGIDNVQVTRALGGICANTTTNISVNITGGVGPFTLVYSNGTTNTTFPNYTSGQAIQVSPATTTTYSVVSITGANGCPGIGNTGTAQVVVVPPAVISTQPGNAITCNGNNATFTVGATPAVGNTYQWQVSTDNGATWANVPNAAPYSGTASPTLTITGATSAMNGYRYRAIVRGQCNTSDLTSGSGTLSVNTTPVINTQPANATACIGSTATFTVANTGIGSTYQWQVSTDGGLTWNNVAGGTGATLSVANVTAAQNGFRYRVIVTNPNCATTVTSNGNATLTTVALPTVSLTGANLQVMPGTFTTLTASSTPAAATNGYAWFLNGNPITGTTNTQTVGVDGIGIYRVRVTDINGCSATSNDLIVTGEASDKVFIYPNPNSGVFQVRLYYPGPSIETRTVSIFKNNGQLVATKVFVLDNQAGPYYRMDFNLPRLAAGTYMVRVEDKRSGAYKSGLFVIQHNP